MNNRLVSMSALAMPLVLSLALFLPKSGGQAAQTGQDWAAQQSSTCAIENQAFKAGETLTYKLYYNWNFVWLSAGEVTFRVKEANNQYHFSAVGSTYKSYEWFYRVNDKYDTYVDKQTLLPKTGIRDIEEGKYRLYDRITFDQENGKAFSLRGKSKATAKLDQYPIENCMHDLLSMMYFARNMDFSRYQPGDKVPVKIFMDQETWPLNIRYRGKEENIKIKGLGEFSTIRISPEVVSGGIFPEGTEVNIWASNDGNQVPLLIESPLSVGSVKAVLKSYKGLRHELVSTK